MEIGFGNLHVIPEYRIETNFQRVNAGSLALAFFHGRDDLFGVLAEVAEFVEIRMEARANDAGISGERRRLVGESAFESVADIGEFVDFVEEKTEQGAAAGGRWRQKISQDGKLSERFPESKKFARRCKAERDAARKTFEILNTFQLFANFSADHGLRNELRDSVEPGVDGLAVNQRAKKPRAQKSRAHSGDGDIERRDDRRGIFTGLVGKNWRDEFEIA